MEPSLTITDLRTAPERTWLVTDTRSRARVQIEIRTEPVVEFDRHSAARAMTVFVAVLEGFQFDDVQLDLVNQPLGLPLEKCSVQYRLRIGQDPSLGIITFIASFDEALDGEQDQWRAHECSKTEALEFGRALQLWLNLNLPA